jgi:cobalt-zinc-cadmium efflux system membrane fusion protein
MVACSASATVLVINDDPLLREVFNRVLTRGGQSVLTAAGAAEAVQIVERYPIAAALIDLRLPDDEVAAVARTLRAHRPGLSLILTTHYPGHFRERPDWAILFRYVLPKSIGLEELRQAIRDALLEEAMKPSVPPASTDPVVPTAVDGVPTPVAVPAAGELPERGRFGWLASAGGVIAVVLVLAAFVVFVAEVPLVSRVFGSDATDKAEQTPEPPALPAVKLVRERGVPPHTLLVPEDVRKSLGIRKGGIDVTAVAKAPTQTRPLVLPGSTALDPARLMRIRARFAPAEVIEIAQVPEEGRRSPSGETLLRELRPGDHVQKGDLLGVFYSEVVGQKKNDLIDALVQLRLDEEIHKRSEKANTQGALSELALLTALRNVEGDYNAAERAQYTLKVWNIPEEDLQAVYKEADEIARRKGKRDKTKERLWARVELRAPDEGTLVERNVALHEIVVDNTVNLFQIAKVDRLAILANAPEDELPTLQALTHQQRRWSVRTVGFASAEGLPGTIDEIGYLIDPNQHTAVIKGYIDNPGRKIRAGQFVSATVKVPPPAGVVEIPTDALVDDGQQSVVFVQTDAARHHYTMRRVQVTERFERAVFVRSTPIPEEEQLTSTEAEQGLLRREPLLAGERVLQSGAGELKAALLSMESEPEQVQ